MSAWEATSWLIAAATGMLGLAAGRLWARLRSAEARRRRSHKLQALRTELQRQQLLAGKLEADLHAQQARGFELERELEARESDWAQSSPAPFSFDQQTFQIERSLQATSASQQQDAARIADLERQVRDLQDLLAKLASRSRPSRTVGPTSRPGPKVPTPQSTSP
jgi:uncharacterized membrane-anchored protein YhcB (DUF1043 family)